MKKIIPFSLILLFYSFPLFSQTFSISAGTGINFILGENYYTDDFGRIGLSEDINGTKTNLAGMGLSSEWQFQIFCKYNFEESPLSLTASFNYLPMRGNEPMFIYDNFLNQEIQYDGTTKMDVWSFQIGQITHLIYNT